MNDATIKLAVSQLMTGGQAQFDKFRNNRDILRQRGMVTRTQTIVDSQGGTYQRQYKEFDINALSREQQKQYALAQAITEGETRIQAGISAFAQAVSEGTSAAREEFRGNRYALQGSGGKGGTTHKVTTAEQIAFDINKAGISSAKGVDTMPSIWGMLGDKGLRQMLGIDKQQWDAKQDISKQWRVGKDGQLTNKPGKDEKQEKTAEEQLQGTQTMISSLQSIVTGINQLGIQLPKELNNIFGVLQTITGIVGAIQTMQTVGTFFGIFNRGGVVPHAANGYYVPGTHASGDVTPIMANAGELVLNKSSQGNLANDLKGAEALVQTIDRYQESIMRSSQMGNAASYMPGNNAAASGSPYITGEIIYMGLSAYLESSGRGEIVTSRKRG